MLPDGDWKNRSSPAAGISVVDEEGEAEDDVDEEVEDDVDEEEEEEDDVEDGGEEEEALFESPPHPERPTRSSSAAMARRGTRFIQSLLATWLGTTFIFGS